MSIGLLVAVCILGCASVFSQLTCDIIDELGTFTSKDRLRLSELLKDRGLGLRFIGVEEAQVFSGICLLDYSATANYKYQVLKASRAYMNYFCMTCYNSDREGWRQPIDTLLSAYGWERAVLVADETYSEVFAALSESENYETFMLSSDTTEPVLKDFMSRQVAVLGLRPIFVTASASLTLALLKNGKELEMLSGYAYVLVDEACLYDTAILDQGPLCIVKAGFEKANDWLEYESEAIASAVFSRDLSFSLLNIVAGERDIVGYFSPSLSITQSPVFPGGLAVPPDNSPFKVLIGNSDVYSDSRSSTFAGSSLAISEYKSALPNHSYELYRTRCYNNNDLSSYSQCLALFQQRNASYIFIDGLGAEPFAALAAMQSLAYSLPIVAGQEYFDELSSTSTYPNFVRLVPNFSYFIPHTFRVIEYYGFDQINMFFSDFLVTDGGASFVEYTKNSNINIVTPESLRSLSSDNADSFFSKAAQQIKDSGIRPMVLFLHDTQIWVLLKAMYDLGITVDDVVIFSSIASFPDMLKYPQDDEVRAQVASFTECFICSTIAHFVGSEGERILEKLKDSEAPLQSSCIVYDAFKLTMLTSDLSILRGLTNTGDVMEAFRSVRFVGCSGNVMINLSDNNRKQMMLGVYQFRFLGNDEWDKVKIMEISIEGTQMYYVYDSIVWPGGTTTIPKIYRLNYEDCPYPVERKQRSQEGREASLFITIVVLGVLIIIALPTFFAYHRRSAALDYPTAVFAPSTEDYFLLISTVLDTAFLQLFSPGGDIILQVVLGMVSASLLDTDHYSDGKYYNLLNAVFVVYIGWALSTAVSLRFPKINLSKLYSILLSYIGYVPAVFVSLGVLDCSFTYSEDPTSMRDAVLDMDCYQQCWHDKHIVIAALIIGMLTIYISVIQAFLPRIVKSLEGSHIQLSPIYFQCKVLLQYIVIALFKQQFLISEIGFHVGSLFCSAGLIGLSFQVDCFNIAAVNLKHRLMLTLVFVYQAATTAIHFMPSTVLSVACAISLSIAVSLASIVVASVRLKKLPVIMTEGEKVDASAWFTFAFSLKSVRPPVRRPTIFAKTNEAVTSPADQSPI